MQTFGRRYSHSAQAGEKECPGEPCERLGRLRSWELRAIDARPGCHAAATSTLLVQVARRDDRAYFELRLTTTLRCPVPLEYLAGSPTPTSLSIARMLSDLRIASATRHSFGS